MVIKASVLKGITGIAVLIPTITAVSGISTKKPLFEVQDSKTQKARTTESSNEITGGSDAQKSELDESTTPSISESSDYLTNFLTLPAEETGDVISKDEDEWITLKEKEDFFHHQGFLYEKWAARLIDKDHHKHQAIAHITLLGDGVWSLPGSSDPDSKVRIEKNGVKWEIPMKTIKGSMNNNDYQNGEDTGAGDGEEASKVPNQKAWSGNTWAQISTPSDLTKVGYVHPRTVGGSCDPVILSIIEYVEDRVAPEVSDSTAGANSAWAAPTDVIVSFKGKGRATNQCSKAGVLMKEDSDVKEIKQMTIIDTKNGMAVSTSKKTLKAVSGVRDHEYSGSSALKWWGKKDGEESESMQEENLEIKCPTLMASTGQVHKVWVQKDTESPAKCPGNSNVLIWGTLSPEVKETEEDKSSSSQTSTKMTVNNPLVLQVDNFRAYCKDAQSTGSSQNCKKQTGWGWSHYWYFLKSGKSEVDLNKAQSNITKISKFTSSGSSQSSLAVDPIDYNVCLNIPSDMNFFVKKDSSWTKQTLTSETGGSNEKVKISELTCGKWTETLIGSGDISAAQSADTTIFQHTNNFTSLSLSSQKHSWQYSKVTVPTLTTNNASGDTKLKVDVHRYAYSSGANSGGSSPNWGEVILKVNGILMSGLTAGSKGVHFVD